MISALNGPSACCGSDGAKVANDDAIGTFVAVKGRKRTERKLITEYTKMQLKVPLNVIFLRARL